MASFVAAPCAFSRAPRMYGVPPACNAASLAALIIPASATIVKAASGKSACSASISAWPSYLSPIGTTADRKTVRRGRKGKQDLRPTMPSVLAEAFSRRPSAISLSKANVVVSWKIAVSGSGSSRSAASRERRQIVAMQSSSRKSMLWQTCSRSRDTPPRSRASRTVARFD